MSNDPRPILRMPLKNFKVVGALTEQESVLWKSPDALRAVLLREFDRRASK